MTQRKPYARATPEELATRRRRILLHLRRHGKTSFKALQGKLGISKHSIRLLMDHLMGDGLVRYEREGHEVFWMLGKMPSHEDRPGIEQLSREWPPLMRQWGGFAG